MQDPPVADHLATIQRVLRGIAAGSEVTRLLHDVLAGAVRAAHGSQGLLVGVMDGAAVPLASTGTVARVVVDTADRAVASGRLARRRAPDGVVSAVAQPLRIAQRVVGAIAVGGDGRSLDPALLPLCADAASLALTRRATSVATSVPGALDAVADLAAEVDPTGVLRRIFDAVEHLVGPVTGFCAVVERGGLRIAHCHGIDVDRVRRASRHPEFGALLTAASLRVDPSSHPVVAQLAEGAECAVGVPLLDGGRRAGHLVLLLGDEPDEAARVLLRAFGRHAALALRTADLHGRLVDKQAELAAAVQSIPAPVMAIDGAGRLSLVNSAAAELFSLAGPFEVGRPVLGRLGHPDLEAIATGAREDEIEVTLGRPPRAYRVAVRSVRSDAGRPLGRLLLFADLTQERDARLLEAQHLESGLARAMGEAVRAPLAALHAQVRAVAAALDGDTRAAAVGSVEAAVGHLERIVADLVLVSSPEAARAPDLEQADLVEVVADAVATAGARVSLRVPPSPVPTALDHTKVEQIVLRLLDNALVHTDGPVEVSVGLEGDEAVVRVADHGPGIYSGDVPLLFERSGSRGGVGLYVCRRLAELQGGRIWCDSRLGAGATFALALPVARDLELARR